MKQNKRTEYIGLPYSRQVCEDSSSHIIKHQKKNLLCTKNYTHAFIISTHASSSYLVFFLSSHVQIGHLRRKRPHGPRCFVHRMKQWTRHVSRFCAHCLFYHSQWITLVLKVAATVQFSLVPCLDIYITCFSCSSSQYIFFSTGALKFDLGLDYGNYLSFVLVGHPP